MNFNVFNQYVNVLLYNNESKEKIDSLNSLKYKDSYKILLSLKLKNEELKGLFYDREELIIGDVFLIDGVYHIFHLNKFKDRQAKYDGFCLYHARPVYFNKYKEANPVNLYYFLKHSEKIKNIEYKGNIYQNEVLFKEIDLDIDQSTFEDFLSSNIILLSNIPNSINLKQKKAIVRNYNYIDTDILFMESFFKNEITFNINHNALDDICLNDLLAMKKDINDESFDYFFVGLNDLGYLLLRNHSNNEIIVASDIYFLVNKTYKHLSKYDVDSIYYYNKDELKKYKEILFYTLSS